MTSLILTLWYIGCFIYFSRSMRKRYDAHYELYRRSNKLLAESAIRSTKKLAAISASAPWEVQKEINDFFDKEMEAIDLAMLGIDLDLPDSKNKKHELPLLTRVKRIFKKLLPRKTPKEWKPTDHKEPQLKGKTK